MIESSSVNADIHDRSHAKLLSIVSEFTAAHPSDDDDGWLAALSITGTRGSGKTTVLRSALRSLAEDPRTIVLPTIEPEYFGPGDNILTLVMIRLQRHIESQGTGDRQIELSLELGGPQALRIALDRLIRFSHLLGGESNVQAGSLDQQLSDLSRAAQNGETFVELWRAVVADLASTDQKIIIPIDDPDLRPELLGQILQHIRLLASTPGVVTIACYGPDQARDVLVGRLLSTIPELTRRQASGYVDSQLLKTFPPFLQVPLKPVGAMDRLDFRPIGDSLTLRQALESVSISTPIGDISIDRLLTNGAQSGDGLDFLDMLPGLPRELLYLHRALSHVPSWLPKEDQQRAAVEALVQSALAATRATIPVIATSDLVEIFPQGVTGERPLVRIDYSQISVYGSGARTREAVISASTLVIIGEGSRTLARLERDTIVDGKKAGDTSIPIDRGILSAMLFSREFSSFGMLYDDDVLTPPLAGGRPNQLLNIVVDGDHADRYFFTLPRWRTYGDVFAFMRGWNQIVTVLVDLLNGLHDDPPGLGDWLLVVLLDLTLHVQTQRFDYSPDADLIDALHGPHDGLMALLSGRLERLETEILRSPNEPYETRHGALQKWLDVHLPQMLHPNLVSAEATETVMLHRKRVLQLAGGVAGDTDRELRLATRSRIRGGYGQAWVDGLLKFYEEYLRDAEFDEMAALHARAVVLKRAARGGTSHAVTSGSSAGETNAEADVERALSAMSRVRDATRRRIDADQNER